MVIANHTVHIVRRGFYVAHGGSLSGQLDYSHQRLYKPVNPITDVG